MNYYVIKFKNVCKIIKKIFLKVLHITVKNLRSHEGKWCTSIQQDHQDWLRLFANVDKNLSISSRIKTLKMNVSTKIIRRKLHEVQRLTKLD